ncbi:MAG: sulfatase-like hydrolase/transferase [Blastocatellia bacterium]
MKFPPYQQGSMRSNAHPKATYAAMITRMDSYVGRVLALLQELKLDGETLVLFTSDNGATTGGGMDPVFFDSTAGLRGLKRDLYEGGIRAPMIVRWPGRIKAAQTSPQVWAHWDFLPTAAELAGAKAPAGIDGISMVNALLHEKPGKQQKQHEFLYWEFHERGFFQAVRMGDWKAVRKGAGGPLELYDLKTDRAEQRNLAAAHPAVVAKIESYLKTARTESERWTLLKQQP